MTSEQKWNIGKRSGGWVGGWVGRVGGNEYGNEEKMFRQDGKTIAASDQ